MTVVLDHVLDTVQHLLKKKVALERAVDPDTPDIIADGSRIVQVSLHVYALQLACIVYVGKLRSKVFRMLAALQCEVFKVKLRLKRLMCSDFDMIKTAMVGLSFCFALDICAFGHDLSCLLPNKSKPSPTC